MTSQVPGPAISRRASSVEPQLLAVDIVRRDVGRGAEIHQLKRKHRNFDRRRCDGSPGHIAPGKEHGRHEVRCDEAHDQLLILPDLPRGILQDCAPALQPPVSMGMAAAMTSRRKRSPRNNGPNKTIAGRSACQPF